MPGALPSFAIDLLFDKAMTYNEWNDGPVDEKTIRALRFCEMGADVGQLQPGEIVRVRSDEGKAKRAALAMDMNRPKILTAPSLS
jgi:hypothetical protein